MDSETTVPVFAHRGEILTNLNKFTSLEKFKDSYKNICKLIVKLENKISTFNIPRNPREDAMQTHDKKTLEVLKRQKFNHEQKILQLENEIKTNIQNSKN